MKKLYIKTYGCQMNVYDSARMADVLATLGYETSDTPDDASLIVLNTCHIREKAAEKVYSELGRMKHIKEARAKAGEETLIAVAGCVAQAEGKEIFARQPAVDLVVGPQSYHHLPEMIGKLQRERGHGVDTEFSEVEKFDALPEAKASGPTAFLTIQEGCDKFCTYCVVPYTRGAEYSRPVADILKEAKELIASGAKEITLLGQNVNGFRGEAADGGNWSLARLIRELADKFPGVRLRYVTSHPRDVSDDLIAVHGEVEMLMPYLHLPVQAGSDRILKAMNRGHKAADYLKLVARFREARPDLALSGDFIVGFPGETDADFQDTMKLVREVHYASAFSFKYSPRPGTPAAEIADQVPDEVKTARLYELQALLTEQQRAFNQSCNGKTFTVLFEKPGRDPGQAIGRTPYLQPVHVDNAAHLMGKMAEVKIEQVQPNSLQGALIREREFA